MNQIDSESFVDVVLDKEVRKKAKVVFVNNKSYNLSIEGAYMLGEFVLALGS